MCPCTEEFVSQYCNKCTHQTYKLWVQTYKHESSTEGGGGVKGLYILFLSRTFWEDPEFVRFLDISHLHSLHSDRRRWLKQNRKPLMKKLLHSAPSGQKLHRTPLSSGPNALKVYDTFWSTSRFKWLNTSQALWHTSNCQMRPSDQSGTSHWTLIWALTVSGFSLGLYRPIKTVDSKVSS